MDIETACGLTLLNVRIYVCTLFFLLFGGVQLFTSLILDRAVPFHGTSFNAAHNDVASKIMGLNQVLLAMIVVL